MEEEYQQRKVSSASLDTIEEAKDQPVSRRSSLQSLETDTRYTPYSVSVLITLSNISLIGTQSLNDHLYALILLFVRTNFHDLPLYFGKRKYDDEWYPKEYHITGEFHWAKLLWFQPYEVFHRNTLTVHRSMLIIKELLIFLWRNFVTVLFRLQTPWKFSKSETFPVVYVVWNVCWSCARGLVWFKYIVTSTIWDILPAVCHSCCFRPIKCGREQFEVSSMIMLSLDLGFWFCTCVYNLDVLKKCLNNVSVTCALSNWQVSNIDEHARETQTAAGGREEVLEGNNHVCRKLPQAATGVAFLW